MSLRVFVAMLVLAACLVRDGRSAAPRPEPPKKPPATLIKPPSGKPAPAKPGADGEIEVSQRGDGKPVFATVGKTIVIRLAGERANGHWQITKTTGTAVTAVGKPEYHEAPKGPGKIGGVTVFRYRAAQPGRSQIKFAFVGGDRSKPPAHTFTAEIVVKKE